jgi:hypothetical protein
MKTYLTPSMTVVKLQHRSIICESILDAVEGNAGIGYGGAGSNNEGSIIRTREYNSVWDEEW